MQRVDGAEPGSEILRPPPKDSAWVGLGGAGGELLQADAKLVDLSWQPLARLPRGVAELTALTDLRLAGVPVPLPNSLSALTALSSLDLSHHSSVTALPPVLLMMPRLRTLVLAGNPLLTSLPPLALLQTLDLHGSYLKVLPEGLSGMRALTALNVARNGLTHLPPHLASLPLRVVDVSSNSLSSLGPLLVCPLRQLRASLNCLSAPPLALPSASPQLALLDLSHNALPSLPSSLASLTALMLLNLSHNLLRCLPLLAPLTRLRLLDVSFNRLEALPPLGDLTALRSLNASANQLTHLPPLPRLVLLNELHLSANKLAHLQSLTACTALHSLSVSCNRLAAPLQLPSSLTSLCAAHNLLPRMALSASRLPLLAELSLSANPALRKLPVPLAASLEHLHLNACGLKELPSLVALTRLRSAHLAENPRLLATSQLTSQRLSQLQECTILDPITFDDIPRPLAFAATVGRRPQQEDAHVVHAFADQSLVVALFDGHGGSAAATFAAQHLHSLLAPLLRDHSTTKALAAVLPALHASFQRHWRQQNADVTASSPGASAVIAHLTRTTLTVANVGDTRALLLHEGNPVRLTFEHKAASPSETERICARGGHVVGDSTTAYVNRRLALSRAIGDFRTCIPRRKPTKKS